MPFSKVEGSSREEHPASHRAKRAWNRHAQALGFAIYFGVAMRMSAARQGLASSGEAVSAYPALAEICRRLRCPVLLYASAKTPGSTWPVPGQQVYGLIPVQGIIQGESRMPCTPPWEILLYHLILRSSLAATQQFTAYGPFGVGTGLMSAEITAWLDEMSSVDLGHAADVRK